jgi:ABC-2 type transport system ATP-binding protein
MARAIQVKDLRKAYGTVEAVAGISFEVVEGECFALLGPNGAGKTTTLEILEGYRDRSGGSVEVLGVDPAHGGRDLRERVGIVLQSAGIDRELTVAEVVALFGGYYPHPRDPGEVIELVGLGDKRDARCRTLSGGQQRRPTWPRDRRRPRPDLPRRADHRLRPSAGGAPGS